MRTVEPGSSGFPGICPMPREVRILCRSPPAEVFDSRTLASEALGPQRVRRLFLGNGPGWEAPHLQAGTRARDTSPPDQSVSHGYLACAKKALG